MPEVEAKLTKAEFEKAMDAPISSNIEKDLNDLWAAQKQEPHMWIEIQNTEQDPDPTAFVGYNGVAYVIKKGVKVPVPMGVVNILNYAEREVNYLDEEGKKQTRYYKTYPFSVFGPARPDEVREWKVSHGSVTK